MSLEHKTAIAIITVAIAFISYIPYFRDMLSGKTKPHAFSWLIWAVLNGIAYIGQVHDKGGAGSWPLGFTVLAMTAIFLVSLKKGEKDIRPFDWFCLVAAGLALIPWLLADSPLISIILVTVIDLLGFMPTIRKVYKKPHEETLFTHVLSTIKYGLILVALQAYTAVTVLFPLAVFIADALLVVLIVVRRKQVPQRSR
jgi:hypothetical protein